MQLTEELKTFIKIHGGEDITTILLKRANYPNIDLPFAVTQISARRQIKGKLPSWYANEELIFPSKISAEQCSSEETARYKQDLIDEGIRLCDLTGGLGIDSYFFSQKAEKVSYMERFPEYCEAAQWNFKILQADNIEIIAGDSLQQIEKLPPQDIFYVDPARRGEGNKRIFALQDCEPDLVKIKKLLLDKAPKVIAKISPMADIHHTLTLLPETTEVHVLSVKNECKELLFVLEREENRKTADVTIHCINFTSYGNIQNFSFLLSEEQTAIFSLAEKIERYIYEPNASILKAGAFKCISQQIKINKLHLNSHLYTSGERVDNFPGRIFEIEKTIPFNNKICKTLSRQIPQANITTRNFPLSVEQLRKKTRILEGGNIYLFATTVNEEERILIVCKKLNPLEK